MGCRVRVSSGLTFGSVRRLCSSKRWSLSSLKWLTRLLISRRAMRKILIRGARLTIGKCWLKVHGKGLETVKIM